jgi:Family of unknown function (DUF6928)
MGAKTWMLVYADSNAREALKTKPQLDRRSTQRLAATLFATEKLEDMGDGDLSYTCPPDNELHIGCFQSISVIAAKEFGIDYPSRLPGRFIMAAGKGTVTLHAMHSVVDWFAFAQWTNGKLLRSLSLSPDSGVMEDIGKRLPFEEPYWSGEHPAGGEEEEEDGYPLPFHPLDLGEAALRELFGYQLEGYLDPSLLEPASVPLVRYRRSHLGL